MRAILTFVVVAAIAYFIALLAGVALAERFGMSSFEGEAATMIAFVYAPTVAIVVSGLITAWRVRTPRPAISRRDGASGGLRTTIAAVLLGYGAGWLVRWLVFDGRSFEHYWQAWIVSVLPYLGAVVLGAIAYLLTARSTN
jgi:hypothetical protein